MVWGCYYEKLLGSKSPVEPARAITRRHNHSHTSINKRSKWDYTSHMIIVGVNWTVLWFGDDKKRLDKTLFQSWLRHTQTSHLSPVHQQMQQPHKQRVHSEENYIDLIHLTGPLRYLVIGWLSWSLILWAELQQLLASIKSSSAFDRTHLLLSY